MTTASMTNSQSKANREFGEYDNDPDERGTANARDAGVHNNDTVFPSERIIELAKHKEPFMGLNTCIRPDVIWGTQDLLWPVSPRAMSGNASPRLEELATPKKDFQKGTIYDNRPSYFYSAGRASVIWTVSEGAKKGSATERVYHLAQPKPLHAAGQEDKRQYFYSCGRESPIWTTQQSAKEPKDRARTTALAAHKEGHPDFQGERPVQSIVSKAACLATASSRVISLAEPKVRNEGQFRDPEWKVIQQSKSTPVSPRCAELAKSKPLAEGFQYGRNVEWPVSNAAKSAKVTGRLEELSRPINRATMDHVQFNPHAFSVKATALKGVVPRRVEELAQPVNR